jgi:hypothetical protein
MQLWQHGLAEIREDVAIAKEPRDRDPREIIQNRPLGGVGVQTRAVCLHAIQAKLSDATAHALADLTPDFAASTPAKLKAWQGPLKKLDAFGVLHLFAEVADQLHRACLRTRFPFTLGKHEADGDTRAKIVKRVVEHCIAVKVDFETVRRLQESVALGRKQLRDSSDRRWCVTLDVSSLFSTIVLELPPCSAKSIAERNVDVFMSMILRTLMADYDFIPGNGDVDPHPIEHSMLRMTMRGLDHHVTMGDGLVELLEIGSTLLNPGFEGCRGLHVFEGDSDRLLHTISSLAATPIAGAA